MSYLAILGRQPELGLVELESILGADKVHPFGATALINESIDINQLGGTLKLGRVLVQVPFKRLDRLEFDLNELPIGSGKTQFGVSVYGPVSPAIAKAYGLDLKRRLKESRLPAGRQGSLRLVAAAPEQTAISAAQLKYNHIPDKGFELLVVVADKQAIIALTEQIQDIDWYSKRDFGRPARSATVGMLPPKLAQILMNTTNTQKIDDPFCGTGVVLQEALLMGREAVGTDLDPAMVNATRTNLEWLGREAKAKLPDWSVGQADAASVKLPANIAIVSEGYLGPNLHPGQAIAAADKHVLTELYHRSLRAWAAQLPGGAQVTICAPVWENQTLGLVDALPDLGYTLKSFAHTDSRQLIYRRPDQSVGRQILILTRT